MLYTKKNIILCHQVITIFVKINQHECHRCVGEKDKWLIRQKCSKSAYSSIMRRRSTLVNTTVFWARGKNNSCETAYDLIKTHIFIKMQIISMNGVDDINSDYYGVPQGNCPRIGPNQCVIQ